MAKEEKKSILWFAIFLSFCVVTILGLGIASVKADDPTTVIPTVEVGNSTPVVSSVDLNEGAVITLTENTTKNVPCGATITDNNGWSTIASATAKIYRSSTTNFSACTADDNDCYFVNGCTLGATTSNTRNATCTAAILFHADSTDASSTNYADETWACEVTGWDSDDASATNTDSTPPELATQYAIQLDAAIDYLSLSLNESSTAKTLNATNTGNEIIDLNIYGEDMGTSTFSIAAAQQEFSSTTFTHSDGAGTDLATSGTSINYDIDLAKPTSSPSLSVESIFWNILIPAAQDPGTYTGTTTISAIGEL